MKNWKVSLDKFITSFSANMLIFAPVALADGMDFGDPETPGTLANTIGQIVGILGWIAVAVCVFKVIQIGILFVTSAGGKSKAKEAILPWLIGVFICATFATLGPLIIDLFDTGMNVFEY